MINDSHVFSRLPEVGFMGGGGGGLLHYNTGEGAPYRKSEQNGI